MINYTLPKNPIQTYPATQGNQITKQYYNMLVGEINRGTMYRAVCRIENKKFYNDIRYYLISDR